MKKVLIIFGTRPEVIKLAPIYFKLNHCNQFNIKMCSTGQHKEMLTQVLDFFKIKLDFNLDLMTENQELVSLTSKMLTSVNSVISKSKPDYIIVQGDTTTAFIGALIGFLSKIKIIHVEAGLRSNDKYSPFPEEVNRQMISILSSIHFTPTVEASNNLRIENISKNVFHVGNSVIDALLLGLSLITDDDEVLLHKKFSFIDFNKKIILITGHRRESFGQPFENICSAIEILANKYSNLIQFVYPVHLNPNVQKPVNRILGQLDNVHLISPLGYKEFIWLMNKSYFVITDSGGVQEEAPSLGKPVIVLRDVTERLEGVEAGNAILVGTDKKKIVNTIVNLIENPELYEKMSKVINPYGDGKTSEKILRILLSFE